VLTVEAVTSIWPVVSVTRRSFSKPSVAHLDSRGVRR
jgi:hypothetical protein